MNEIRNLLIYYRMRFPLKALSKVVERQFNEQEFLDSAKDAYWIVSKLFNDKEYETLSGMLSQKLLVAFKETHEHYEKSGLEFRLVEQDVQDALVVSVMPMRRAEMAVLDPEAVAAAPSVPEDAWEGGGTMAAAQQLQRQLAMNPFRAAWLVISVEFRGKQTIETRAISTGKVKSVLEDQRRHTWRFARGPLPAEGLPVRTLEEMDWRVLDMVN